jgi:hypothetical protein
MEKKTLAYRWFAGQVAADLRGIGDYLDVEVAFAGTVEFGEEDALPAA